MKNPAELSRRAQELKDRADGEHDPGVRERLIRMSIYYVHIAESEEWLASHPTSIASLGSVFQKDDD